MTNFILKNASDADFTQLFFAGIDNYLTTGTTEFYEEVVNAFWGWYEPIFKKGAIKRYLNIWLSLPYRAEEWER